MPAPASCPITIPDEVLNGLLTPDDHTDGVDFDVLITTGPSLLDALHQVPDPRDRRGIRHDFFAILALAICATLTGARGYAAIWRWSAQTLTCTCTCTCTRAALGITGPIHSETTIRLTLQTTDPDTLNTVVALWLATWLNHLEELHQRTPDPTSDPTPDSGKVTVIAVDGKTVRGSRDHDTPGTHLLAVFDTTHGVPLDQVSVDTKTHEITHLPTLLARLNDHGLLSEGTVVTADALHTQRSTAHAIVDLGADYVFTVKANQPKLHDHVAALPWNSMPTTDSCYDRGHGRLEERHTIVATVTDAAGGLHNFPHARQVLRIVRRRRKLHEEPGQDSIEVAYLITSIEPGDCTTTSWPSWCAGIGEWRTASTTSETPPSTKTTAEPAPVTARPSSPHYATWPSPSCDYSATATSEPLWNTTPTTATAPSRPFNEWDDRLRRSPAFGPAG